jgi:hypothetical protein
MMIRIRKLMEDESMKAIKSMPVVLILAVMLPQLSCESPEQGNESVEFVVQSGAEQANLCSLSGYIKKAIPVMPKERGCGLCVIMRLLALPLYWTRTGYLPSRTSRRVFIRSISRGKRTMIDDSYVTVEVPSYNNLTYILVQAGNANDGAIIKKQTVSGVMSREEGGYAEGASIQLYQGSALYGSTPTTNVGGAYTLYYVLNGAYTVRIELEGYNIPESV